MPVVKHRILAINPGSTSTKIAVYENDAALITVNVKHSEADLAAFRGRPILDQSGFRRELIEDELRRAGIELTSLSAVAGRGGLLRPVESGTYKVDRMMLNELREAKRGEHASNLGASSRRNWQRRSTSKLTSSIRSASMNGQSMCDFRSLR